MASTCECNPSDPVCILFRCSVSTSGEALLVVTGSLEFLKASLANQDKGISSLPSFFNVLCYMVRSGIFFSFLSDKWINTRNAEHLSVICSI